jgi:hypothetical protein
MELQRLERAESTIKTGVSPFLFFSLPKPYMAKTHTQPVHTILALSVIGVASSFVFVLSALASGMVPSEVITLANHARTEAGLPALTENSYYSLRRSLKSFSKYASEMDAKPSRR